MPVGKSGIPITGKRRFSCKHSLFRPGCLILLVCNRRAVLGRACLDDSGEEGVSIVGEMTDGVGEKTQPKVKTVLSRVAKLSFSNT